MTKYRVYLQGKNFLLNLDEEPEKHGFYTTRFVEANNSEEAENKSINMVRNDPDLKAAVLNEQDNPPMIYTKKIGGWFSLRPKFTWAGKWANTRFAPTMPDLYGIYAISCLRPYAVWPTLEPSPKIDELVSFKGISLPGSGYTFYCENTEG